MIRRASAALVLVLSAGGADAQQGPGALAARVAAGDSAWVREDHDAARTAYRAVVRADSSFSPRAVFRLGLLESWRNRYSDALTLLRLYARLEPADLDGRLALARTLAWADRIPEAERLLEQWLEQSPQDAEAWGLLGQFRRWRGAPRSAEVALRRALATDSTERNAQEQLRWVEADLHPVATSTAVLARDSERNDLWHLDVAGSARLLHDVRVGAQVRSTRVSVDGVDPLVVPGVLATAQWQPDGAPWMVAMELGGVQYPAAAAPSALQGRAGLRAATRSGRWRLGGGIGREPLDELRSMASRALMFTVGNADLSYALTSRTSFGLAASRGDVRGVGVDNSRTTALGALRFTPRRGISTALTHRVVRWDAPAFGVFFAPQTWTVTEASLGWERPVDLGLLLGADVAVGAQSVAFLSDPATRSSAPRAAARFGYRARPGREILATLVYANVAGVGTISASDYRYGALTIAGRWTF